jgi:hypothetical protein
MLFIIVGILTIVSRSPKLKGMIGEIAVAYRLKKLDPVKYRVLHDVTIPSQNGKTTQIDHLVFSEFGIFVIEVKNYQGWIVGKEHAEYWTQVIYKRKERLYNPLRQNYGHVEALKSFFSDLPELYYIPIVAFSGRADLKVEVQSIVIYNDQILSTIQSHSTPVIASEDLNQAFKRLNEYKASKPKRATNREHVKTVKRDLQEKADRIHNKICPKCNGELVVRHGEFGRFTGCSNYPKCRFIVK